MSVQNSVRNSFVTFFPLPPPDHFYTSNYLYYSWKFCKDLSDPDRSSDKILCMHRMQKLTKKTPCAAETSPEVGFHGFSSYTLN